MHLVRLGENDYRSYQRLIRGLNHSINPNGHSVVSKETVDQIIQDNRTALLSKQVFINSMSDPTVEAYFLREDDADENIGIVYMKFSSDNKQCYIVDFGLVEHKKGQGIGTEFFNLLLEEVIRPKQSKVVTLNCPFPGAQIFWNKMGFVYVINADYHRGNPFMKKKL